MVGVIPLCAVQRGIDDIKRRRAKRLLIAQFDTTIGLSGYRLWVQAIQYGQYRSWANSTNPFSAIMDGM